MFEIAFNEIFLIMVIALVVVGPERLPAMARKAGALMGKMRRFVTNVKQDIDKEIKADELKQIMQDQADSVGIHDIIEETRESFEKAEADYNQDQPKNENEKLVNEALAKQDKLANKSSEKTTEPLNTSLEKDQAKSNSSHS
ncbi:Twin-arginine translocation protein TatB [hydrothermal vent metagenome]|uniref:Twin-arginine translocation protein TatB n=1 Tax=hydrothermal vent metagenome TaxID=652676 RepID=A0A3B0YPB3_9ZZZZ